METKINSNHLAMLSQGRHTQPIKKPRGQTQSLARRALVILQRFL